MNPSGPIGIFDSGLGGLTLVKSVLETLPNESLIYIGDNARAPYGRKSLEELRAFSLEITEYLVGQGIKALVVACNTATAAAINLLRETWPDLPILGMEPAVKPAATATRSGVVGVLATQATFSSPRYSELMDRYGYHITVLEDPCLGLVERIEAGEIESAETKAFLQGILQPLLDQGADAIVLGCTHYPLVRPLIEEIVGPEVEVIDPAPSVAMHLKYRLERNGLLNPGLQSPKFRFHFTGTIEIGVKIVEEYLEVEEPTSIETGTLG